jgi:hypothetical protein
MSFKSYNYRLLGIEIQDNLEANVVLIHTYHINKMEI